MSLPVHLLLLVPALTTGVQDIHTDNTGWEQSTSPSLVPATKALQHNPSRIGKYSVSEQVQSAPRADHPCRPSNISVRVTFPEMQTHIYVNFLGYKEPRLVQVLRCQGECREGRECRPTQVTHKQVIMFFKSFLTGSQARTSQQKVELEEHLQCECVCGEESGSQCNDRYKPAPCSSPDNVRRRSVCEGRGEEWDGQICDCVNGGNRVVERNVDTQPPYSQCTDLLLRDNYRHRIGYRTLDMVGWVMLGSSLSLVVILSGTTWHYRKKSRLIKQGQMAAARSRSCHEPRESRDSALTRGRSRSKPITKKKKKPKEEGRLRFSFNGRENGRETRPRDQATEDSIQMTIENIMLLSGGGELYHEQYNEHGVKIENQCFP